MESADAAIARYEQLNLLLDGTAVITISDENGALATPDDLHKMRGAD
nr:hypothetical protein [uncultured Caulobacter sp.]